jgi:hypothetical protein
MKSNIKFRLLMVIGGDYFDIAVAFGTGFDVDIENPF